MCVLLLLFVAQYLFWKKNVDVKAFLDIVPTPPNEKTVSAFTFGDTEFYYRTKVFKVQNMGDTFGRFTALRKYDYKKLYNWFIVLEKLNTKSTYLPSLAAYYYSQTQNIEDRIYVVDFLRQHTMRDPQKKWWWLYQAVYIAYYGMKNEELGIELAYQLKDIVPDDAPLWTKQMVGILLAKKGDDCEAVRVVGEVLNDFERNTTKTEEEKLNELNYMRYFINSKIELLKSKNINVNDCLTKEINND
jgi:hypothetical protein